MSNSASVLKEFLVKIGFKVDDQQFRRFSEVMHSTGKSAVELGKTTLAATTVMGASLTKIGEQLEGLYYASRRTGASAGELKSFAFAASQIGVSAEQAQNAIEGLAAARRTNPGLNGILGGLGIDPKQTDNAKVMLQLLQKLHAMPYFQAAQIAGMFGINEQTFQMLEAGLPEMQKYLALREKMFKAAGINPSDMTARSHEFMTHLRTFEAVLGNLADIIAYRLMPWGEKAIDWLSDMVGWLTKADKATGGWSSKILGILTALAGGSLVKGGLGMLGKIFGRGAVGAAAGAAAGAGEGAAVAEGGAGLLSLISLPAVIIAAVAAALVWMGAHPEQVRKAAGAAWDWTKKTAENAGTEIKEGIKAIGQSGGWVKSLSTMPGMIGDLARMTGKFEGFSKKIYNDIAGNATFGFGHKLKPGESMAGVDPISLFVADLKDSLSAVMRNVKVKLSQNQIKSLADLEYNIGESRFHNSTLVKKLNSGDFAGAAAQFERWNKVMQNGHLVANQTLSNRRAAEAQMFRTPDGKSLTFQTTIKVDGSDSPKETAREVGRQQNRVYGDLVRNFGGAFQ